MRELPQVHILNLMKVLIKFGGGFMQTVYLREDIEGQEFFNTSVEERIRFFETNPCILTTIVYIRHMLPVSYKCIMLPSSEYSTATYGRHSTVDISIQVEVINSMINEYRRLTGTI